MPALQKSVSLFSKEAGPVLHVQELRAQVQREELMIEEETLKVVFS
jgi:hypothetical protein